MSMSRKDNRLQTARNLREITGTKTVKGFVGKQDKIDIYQFTLRRSSNVALSLSQLKANADLSLLNRSGAVLANSKQLKKLPESIATTLEAGSYYLRVNRRDGNTRYKLTLAATSEPGASLDVALDAGILGNNQVYQGAIGGPDEVDYYKLTLNQNSDIYAELGGLSIGTDINLIRDFNGNGFVDGNERIATGYANAFDNNPISKTLPSGTYFIEVRAISSTSSSYNLTLSATPQPSSIASDPGSFINTAYDLGAISGNLLVKELAGALDSTDYYKFTLKQNSNFNATLSRLSSSLDIDLIFDANKNGFLDGNERIAFGYGSTFGNQPISEVLPAGTYFIEVQSSSSYANTIYDLALSATAIPTSIAIDPGKTLSTAYNLGSLTSGQRIVNEVVGDLDKLDYYKFTLNQAGNVSAMLSGVSREVSVELIRDTNGNGLIEAEERLDTGYGSTTFNQSIAQTVQPGTYFIEVRESTYSGNTAYTLTLSS
jgi:hypothetical protein